MKGGVGRERGGRHGADGEGGVGGTDKGRENRLTKVRYEEEVKKKIKPKVGFKVDHKTKGILSRWDKVIISGDQESRAGAESGVRCRSSEQVR